jgi:hypothetical protein
VGEEDPENSLHPEPGPVVVAEAVELLFSGGSWRMILARP